MTKRGEEPEDSVLSQICYTVNNDVLGRFFQIPELAEAYRISQPYICMLMFDSYTTFEQRIHILMTLAEINQAYL